MVRSDKPLSRAARKPAKSNRRTSTKALKKHGALLIRAPQPMRPPAIKDFFDRLAEIRPKPTTELHYTNAFTLLVAVVLSAQATDVGVNRATASLFMIADTPEAMIKLGERRLLEALKSLNYYRGKARNILALSQILLSRYQGQVPRDRAALEALPGVGRKTANVILNTAFGEPTIAVDTHIFRVANRTGLAIGDTPLAVEEGLLQRVPKDRQHDAHHWLILHGRYVCKAKKPDCPLCPVRDLCLYPAKIA